MNKYYQYIRDSEENYRPNAEITQKIQERRIKLGLVLGPFGVGKSSLIWRACKLDGPDGLNRVKSFTTRPQRSNEKRIQYNFKAFTAETFSQLHVQIKGGSLVQYKRAPFNDHIYGTNIGSYNSPLMLADVMAASVPQFEALPFEGLKKIVIASQPEVWQKTSRSRMAQHSQTEIKGRIKEGIEGLTWGLECGGEVSWVEVRDSIGQASRAGTELHDLMHETTEPNLEGRAAGEHLMKYMQQLLS